MVSSGKRAPKSSASTSARAAFPAKASATAAPYCTSAPFESASAPTARRRASVALPKRASRRAALTCHNAAVSFSSARLAEATARRENSRALLSRPEWRPYRLPRPAAHDLFLACPQPRLLAAPSLSHRPARRQAGTDRSAGQENRALSPAPLWPWPRPPLGDSERDRSSSHRLPGRGGRPHGTPQGICHFGRDNRRRRPSCSSAPYL